MCPNNGMGLQTIATRLGQGATTAWISKKLTLAKRTRSCNGFSGCTQWSVGSAFSLNDNDILSEGSLPASPLIMLKNFQLSNNGQELNYFIGYNDGAKGTSFVYAPKTPYSFSLVSPNGYDITERTTNKALTFSGFLGNSCASFFTDVFKKNVGTAVTEYQYVIYGTF